MPRFESSSPSSNALPGSLYKGEPGLFLGRLMAMTCYCLKTWFVLLLA